MGTDERLVAPPQLRVIKVLPPLGTAQIGEMFLLIDGGADNNKIHVRTVSGWIKTAALS